jgi:hypothetical protein
MQALYITPRPERGRSRTWPADTAATSPYGLISYFFSLLCISLTGEPNAAATAWPSSSSGVIAFSACCHFDFHDTDTYSS